MINDKSHRKIDAISRLAISEFNNFSVVNSSCISLSSSLNLYFIGTVKVDTLHSVNLNVMVCLFSNV